MLKQLQEAFPVGSNVRLIDNNGMRAPLGSIGTVLGYNHGGYGDYFLDIKWIRTDSNLEQMDGGYSGYHFEIVDNIQQHPKATETKSEWNSVCQRCGAPAYQGLFKVECSKGC